MEEKEMFFTCYASRFFHIPIIWTITSPSLHRTVLVQSCPCAIIHRSACHFKSVVGDNYYAPLIHYSIGNRGQPENLKLASPIIHLLCHSLT